MEGKSLGGCEEEVGRSDCNFYNLRRFHEESYGT